MSHSFKGVLRVMGIAVLILGLVLIFSGCGGGGGLVGTWSNAERGETIEFTSDGRMIGSSDTEGSFELAYKVDGNSLVLSIEGFEGFEAPPTPFSVDGDTLTVTDPAEGSITYKRQ